MNKQKKQTVVLAALVAVIAAVGAFQFMGNKPKPAAGDGPKKKAASEETLVADNTTATDPTQYVIDTLIANSATPRDPFQPQAVVLDDPGHQGEPQPTNKVNPYDQYGGQRPDNEIGGQFPNHGQGSGTGVGPITIDPALVNQGNGNTTGGLNGQPFALRGVMIGRSKKLCMIELSDGRQTLISEGQSFGSELETTVVSITEEAVVLRHKGVEKTYALHGGN
jgi:hypothetical protein